MPELKALDFTAGPAGGNVTISNTPEITAQSGANPIFSTSIPPDQAAGTFSAEVDQSNASLSFSSIDFTAQSNGVWFGFYFYLKAISTFDNGYWATWRSGTAKIGDIRYNLNAQTISLRDNNTAVITSGTIPLTTWHRAAIYCAPGSATGHRLKLYLGTNRHGSIPDFDAQGAATSAAQTSASLFRFGNLLNTGDVHYRLSRIRINTVEPEPLTPPPVNVQDVTYWNNETAWLPVTQRFVNGSAWV